MIIPAMVGVYFNLNAVKIFCAICGLFGTLFVAIILPTQLIENTEYSVKLLKYYGIFFVIILIFLT